MEKQVFYNFKNSIFSKNSLYKWVYCLENSKLICFHITGFDTVFDLLTHFAGCDDLLLHNSLETISNNNEQRISKTEIEASNFFHSKLNEKNYYNTLIISTWPDEMIVGSAVFYVLENLYQTHTDQFEYYLPYLIKSLSPLFFSAKFNEIVVEIFQNTKIIKHNMKKCCFGFSMFLQYIHYFEELETRFLTDKKVLINFLGLLQATEQETSNIVESCFQTNSIFELKKFIEKKK